MLVPVTDLATLSLLAPIALAPVALAQFGGFSSLEDFFVKTVEKSRAEKTAYIEKLETAVGDDIFKYILLINVSALEGYVAQTRIQAEQSFSLARMMAWIG